MIPKRLKIKGLYSYQKEQEIDFAPLTDASLFGIFGAVGSGKSSILEAITFALYGNTERLNAKGDDRTYNMMNLRSNELLIDFECIAGKTGDSYRFIVRGKRSSKNFKEVKTFERRVYKWVDENWVSLPENEFGESVIGLSYANFRRSIIIPQGRFQEFIELPDRERTQMMKELFQLERFDLWGNVGSLSSKNNLAISGLEGQLIGLGEVNADMIAAEEKKRDEIKENIRQVSTELTAQNVLDTAFQKSKEAAEKIARLISELTQLKSQQAEMERRETELKRFETCSIHFKSLFDQKNNLTLAITRDEKVHSQNALRMTGLDTSIVQQREALADLKLQYDKREELIDKAEDLEKVIQILDQNAELARKKERLGSGEIVLAAKEKDIEFLKAERENKETEIAQLRSKVADISELTMVKTWFAALDNLQEIRQSIKTEAENLQAELVALQKKLHDQVGLLTLRFALKTVSNPSPADLEMAVQNFSTEKETSRKSLNEQVIGARTKLALHQYAGSLKEGLPCPLCGADHHPAVLHVDDAVPRELAELEKNLSALDLQERELRSLIPPVEKLFTQIENLEKQKNAIRQRFGEAKQKLEDHDGKFEWKAFDKNDRASFDKTFDEVSGIQGKLRTEETALKTIAARLEAALQEKSEKIEKPLQELRNDILRTENTAATLAAQLRSVKAKDFEENERASIQQQIITLRGEYVDLTKRFEETERKVNVLGQELNVLSGSQQALSASLETGRENLSGIQSQISSQLETYGFSVEEEVSQILSRPIAIDQERKVIEQFRFALESTTRELQTVSTENPENQYNADQHQEVLVKKRELGEQLEVLQKEAGGIDRHLKKMADDLARKLVLETEKARLLLRKEHLNSLSSLFRSSGFVDYASSIYLQNLIQSANHRFHQMTHQQLHLELGEGNSFWVRDLLNGGHLRLLKTLSGGQKFQAALSLALALADHIHIRNESRHNFFFLDEGFGSLDKNALQTVFETLKSLRKENRIVGIISHVEDLQQEIQTFLRVTESDEGSRIAESWK